MHLMSACCNYQYLQQTPEKQRSRPNSVVSEMLAERRKTGGDNSDTASLLSVSSHRSDRRRTGECHLEGKISDYGLSLLAVIHTLIYDHRYNCLPVWLR